jgi:4-amino-4-deoxy-L-arabinose transferase-like glycosyltransferase
MHRSRWLAWPGAALLLLALAFGLRVYRLDGPSLWYDEAFSIALARSGVWQPLEAHPPLFYLILRLWMALAGSSEFSARFLSVGVGVLTVALFGAAAARLGRSPWAGLLGLALAATLPFWIWESREVRMYSALGMWTALALWMELQGRLGGPPSRSWPGSTPITRCSGWCPGGCSSSGRAGGLAGRGR